MKRPFTKPLLIASCLLLSISSPSFAENDPKGKGFDLSEMDKTVDPSTDFYHYAVGNWIKANPIPAEYSRWGCFEELVERNNVILKQILEKAASKNATKGSIVQKVGSFYKTGMDSAKIEKNGINPISSTLMKIGMINSKKGLYEMLAFLQLNVGSPCFNFFGEADAQNSNMVIAWLYQGGLGLPDRDY